MSAPLQVNHYLTFDSICVSLSRPETFSRLLPKHMAVWIKSALFQMLCADYSSCFLCKPFCNHLLSSSTFNVLLISFLLSLMPALFSTPEGIGFSAPWFSHSMKARGRAKRCALPEKSQCHIRPDQKWSWLKCHSTEFEPASYLVPTISESFSLLSVFLLVTALSMKH